MDWLQVRIELGRLEPEAVEAALLALGAVAVAYRDAGDEPILEPAPGSTPLWQELVVSALLPADTDISRVQLSVAAAVAPAALPAMQFEMLPDRDWIGDFQAGLQALRFGRSLWIVPRGMDPPPHAATVVQLEPGLAFGTGRHPTTALCLDWLNTLRCEGTVLDFGCGSGILALAAVALGARHAVAVDTDPQALAACAENARRNGMLDAFTILPPDELAEGRRFDAVVANILSGPLQQLAPLLGSRPKPGAPIALTGILPEQADTVRQAYGPWVDFDPDSRRGDWVLLSGRARVRI